MGHIIQSFNKGKKKKQTNKQFLCNVTHTCIKFFTKTIQIIKKKKTLHTSIISESIKFLVKKYSREVIRMLSKILLYTIRGK